MAPCLWATNFRFFLFGHRSRLVRMNKSHDNDVDGGGGGDGGDGSLVLLLVSLR